MREIGRGFDRDYFHHLQSKLLLDVAHPRYVSLPCNCRMSGRSASTMLPSNASSASTVSAAKVAFTVDADDALLGNIVEALRPDILQLHGKETMTRVRDIKQKFGLQVMKVIAVETAADLGALPGYADVADRILFDARAPDEATRPGGPARRSTGVCWNNLS